VAIIDDLGAIVIIALFYTERLSATALLAAAIGAAALLALNRARVMRVDVYAIVGLLVWLAVLKSGVHATLAGVITALAIPTRDAQGGSPLQDVEHGLHPWVAFAVLPMFAFCNAGVSLEGASFATLLEPIPLGIALGLVAGKTIGVLGTSWLLIRTGLAERPAGASWTQFLGVAVLCGIGFTMSLFIGTLAFPTDDQLPLVRLGVIVGSLLSAVLGYLVLRLQAAAPATER
jgi:Na+:H+ antiporter, NhaA family